MDAIAILYRILGNLLKMIKIGLFLLMFLLLVAVITNYWENLLEIPIFVKAVAIENHLDQPAVNVIKSLVPTTLYNTDISRAILFVLMFIAAHICSFVGKRLRFKAEHMKKKRSMKNGANKLMPPGRKNKF